MNGIAHAQLNTNGSFENSEVGTASGTEVEGWLLLLETGADAVFEVVDDTVQHGDKALRASLNTIGSNSWDIQVVADSIPVQQGETYRYSVWARSSGSSHVNFTVGNYAYNEYDGVIRPSTPNVTTAWQEYTFTFTVDDAVTYIRAPIHFSLTANSGDSIYIDHLDIHNIQDEIEARKPVIVEAESGEVGADFNILQVDTVHYVSIQTNLIAYNPGSSARMISYEVTFPDTGTYDLFVRLRIGPASWDDDSFFYGNGFGEKDSTTDADWIFVNGLAAAGFSNPGDVVLEAGALGSGVWKWVNLSHNAYQGDTTLHFTILEDSRTDTFQIGAREDGLDIDKLAFGKSYLYYTVDNLDNREPGSTELPHEGYEGPPLASNQPKFVGNIYSLSQVANFAAYWNQVTPENAGKWGSVESTRDVMNWSGLDAAYNLAKNNDFPFHFHVLVWGAQQPAWIDGLQLAEQLEEITEWFQAVADRYDDIDYLEVVNEPLPGHNPPDGTGDRANYKAALGSDGETGWDWVLNAFRMARDIFPPDTKLMINEFNILSAPPGSIALADYLTIIRLLQAEDLIDIIGAQGHAFSTTVPVVDMRRNLDSLAATGLPIQITELDIDGTSDAIQLQSYQRIFPALYEHPGVEGITLWGWRRGLWRDAQGAYILNQDGSERPALVWLRDYLDTVDVSVPVAVEDFAGLPNAFQLYPNYPNPFNPLSTIGYDLPHASTVSLIIYDILGREVARLVADYQEPGYHQVQWNGQQFAAGIYIARLATPDYAKSIKMLLLK
ncbi:MAG: endo-1,4-beta-xylanase [Fidelibacterota bacterium]|nr:MAG: endo-1,4-beta-xylanase [Candidatus Neomarinimicrobiota bacterium]